MRLMRSVARRVTLNLSEAKRLTILNDNPFVSATALSFHWRFKNIFAQMYPATGGSGATTPGTSWGTVGNEIVDPMWKFKVSLTIRAASMLADAASVYGSMVFHIYIIAANDYVDTVLGGAPPPGTLAWTTYPPLYDASDPGWFINNDPFKATINGNNARVVKHWVRKWTPTIVYERFNPTADTGTSASGTVVQTFKGMKRWKRKFTFEDNPVADTDSNFLRSGTLRGTNYYLLCGWGAIGNVPAAIQPTLNFDQYMYFKDP